VETQTRAGKVRAEVEILGADLTRATIVGFHGTAAAFTVVSPALISATVPAGANGRGQPSGTLNSNTPFEVLP
jgi:hypothetical protein